MNLFLFFLICYFESVYSRICGTNIPAMARNAVIGIVAIEEFKNDGLTGRAYIVASYVKLIESAGAQVVPILPKQSDDYYTDLAKKLNGVVLPGQAVNLQQTSYLKISKIFIDIARQDKKKLAIWGIGSGFEVLILNVSPQTDATHECESFDFRSSLFFLNKKSLKKTQWFEYATFSLLKVSCQFDFF